MYVIRVFFAIFVSVTIFVNNCLNLNFYLLFIKFRQDKDKKQNWIFMYQLPSESTTGSHMHFAAQICQGKQTQNIQRQLFQS